MPIPAELLPAPSLPHPHIYKLVWALTRSPVPLGLGTSIAIVNYIEVFENTLPTQFLIASTFH